MEVPGAASVNVSIVSAAVDGAVGPSSRLSQKHSGNVLLTACSPVLLIRTGAVLTGRPGGHAPVRGLAPTGPPK